MGQNRAYEILCRVTSIEEANRLLDFIVEDKKGPFHNLISTSLYFQVDSREWLGNNMYDNYVYAKIIFEEGPPKFTFGVKSKNCSSSIIGDCLLGLRDAVWGYRPNKDCYCRPAIIYETEKTNLEIILRTLEEG